VDLDAVFYPAESWDIATITSRQSRELGRYGFLSSKQPCPGVSLCPGATLCPGRQTKSPHKQRFRPPGRGGRGDKFTFGYWTHYWTWEPFLDPGTTYGSSQSLSSQRIEIESLANNVVWSRVGTYSRGRRLSIH
jgi:hypothetical protein